MTDRIVATHAALEAVERLTASRGPLMFFISGGCCDGSSPLCLPDRELFVGPNDVLLGRVGGARVYMPAEQDRRWGQPAFVLDVAPGAADGFSLEAGLGLHFVLRPPPKAGEGGSDDVPEALSVAPAAEAGDR